MDDARPFAEIRRTLDDIVHILTLHRWAFFAPFCLAASIAFIVSMYYPRSYSATTLFERRNDPVMIDLPLSAGAASFDYFRTTMKSDIKSLETMRKVVDGLGLTKKFDRDEQGELTKRGQRQRDGLARSLGARLQVETDSPNNQMDRIAITYVGPDPKIGPSLVDKVKEVYIERTMDSIRDFLVRQREYFLDEAEAALKELKAAQREETKLRLENPYANPHDPGMLSTRLSQLQLERKELELRRREYVIEMDSLEQALAAVEPVQSEDTRTGRGEDVAPPAVITERMFQLERSINEIDNELEELRTSKGMTDLHPKIVELLDQRRLLESALAQKREAVLQGASTNRSANLDSSFRPGATIIPFPFVGEQARLKTQMASQERKIAEVDISMQRNEEEVSQLREARAGLFENQEIFNDVQARVSKAGQRHSNLRNILMSIEPAINAVSQDRLMQFSLGQPARGSSRPVSPRATTILLLAILAGAAAGVGCVILAEVLDDVYRSSGQVAKSLGLPILEAIDEIITSQDRRRLTIRRVVVLPAMIITLMGTAGLTGSMAYLNIQKPYMYQKISRIPKAAARLIGVDWSARENQSEDDTTP